MDPENLVPVCPQGCRADKECCKDCIYIPNLNKDDLRTMILEQVYQRLLNDPSYAQERAAEYRRRLI